MAKNGQEPIIKNFAVDPYGRYDPYRNYDTLYTTYLYKDTKIGAAPVWTVYAHTIEELVELSESLCRKYSLFKVSMNKQYVAKEEDRPYDKWAANAETGEVIFDVEAI